MIENPLQRYHEYHATQQHPITQLRRQQQIIFALLSTPLFTFFNLLLIFEFFNFFEWESFYYSNVSVLLLVSCILTLLEVFKIVVLLAIAFLCCTGIILFAMQFGSHATSDFQQFVLQLYYGNTSYRITSNSGENSSEHSMDTSSPPMQEIEQKTTTHSKAETQIRELLLQTSHYLQNGMGWNHSSTLQQQQQLNNNNNTNSSKEIGILLWFFSVLANKVSQWSQQITLFFLKFYRKFIQTQSALAITQHTKIVFWLSFFWHSITSLVHFLYQKVSHTMKQNLISFVMISVGLIVGLIMVGSILCSACFLYLVASLQYFQKEQSFLILHFYSAMELAVALFVLNLCSFAIILVVLFWNSQEKYSIEKVILFCKNRFVRNNHHKRKSGYALVHQHATNEDEEDDDLFSKENSSPQVITTQIIEIDDKILVHNDL